MSSFTKNNNKPFVVAIAVVAITLGFNALSIYVDISIATENATTAEQKRIMWWFAFLAGSFAAISIMLAGAFSVTDMKKTFYASCALAGLLVTYSFINWLSLFATIQHDYSKTAVQSSLAYKANQARLSVLTSKTVEIDATKNNAQYLIELNNRITQEELAMKQCNRIKGWKNVQDCKNKHGAQYEALNRELDVLTSAKDELKTKTAELKELNETAKQITVEKVLMPLADALADDAQTGREVQLMVGLLASIIAVFICNCGNYFAGRLIGNSVFDYIGKRFIHFPTMATPIINAPVRENTADIPATPISFRDNFNSGNIHLADLYQRSAMATPPIQNPITAQATHSVTPPVSSPVNLERGFGHSTVTTDGENAPAGSLYSGSGRVGYTANIPAATGVDTREHTRFHTQMGMNSGMNSGIAAETDTDTVADTVAENSEVTRAIRGISSGANEQEVIDLIQSGEWFRYFTSVSIGNIREYPKVIYNRESGCNQSVATRIQEVVRAHNLPITKAECDVYRIELARQQNAENSEVDNG